VLTVGAFDGLHAFEAERRGASRVFATDVWGRDADEYGAYPSTEGFELVRRYRESTVRACRADAHALPFSCGAFDIVVCLGVIEFVVEPEQVGRELVRVAADKVVFDFPVARSRSSGPIDISSTASGENSTGIDFTNADQEERTPFGVLAGLRDNDGRLERVFVPDYAAHDAFPCPSGRILRCCRVKAHPSGGDVVSHLDADTSVTVLDEREGDCRVEFLTAERSVKQGWVERNVVTSRNDSFRRRLRNVGRSHGVKPFRECVGSIVHDVVKPATRRLSRPRGQRAVVHVTCGM
jgi:hypothetical protein